jgi:hypothetical protein
MADLLDEVFEDVSSIAPDTAPAVDDKVVVDDLPEKYRGKSAKEIAKMHEEAERLISRQGGEVGELRKVVDDFIKTQTSKESKTVEPELSDTDFYVKPREAIDKAIDSHPAIKEAKSASLQYKRNDTLARLAKDFPDFMDTVNDDNFANWVNSSKVRKELFLRAETQFDYDSANELLSTWNERKQLTQKVTDTSKIDREKQLQAADVGSTGANEPVSKKKYRRSDIIKLMQTDPDRYAALSDEIMRAYQEGRVI